jgi:hypothetical protein
MFHHQQRMPAGTHQRAPDGERRAEVRRRVMVRTRQLDAGSAHGRVSEQPLADRPVAKTA